jgi:hypothetical protein
VNEWTEPDPDIAAFIAEYDRRGSDDDADPTALFAPHFLALDPAHAVPLTPAVLASVLPARRAARLSPVEGLATT